MSRPQSAAECVLGRCPEPHYCDSISQCDAWFDPAPKLTFPLIDNQSPPGAWAEHFARMPQESAPPAIKFKRLPHGGDLPLPCYATAGAAGMDICAADSGKVFPGSAVAIPTGFNVEIPDGWEIQVRPRSSLSFKHGISITNSPGTIDSDYRGEIKVLCHNHGRRTFHYRRGDRIAQLVLAPVHRMPVVEVAELSPSGRGAGGFGSTGR